MDKINLLLVDDHALFRDGLRSLLERQEGWAVVGEAGDAGTGIRLAEEVHPDVILMDLHLPGRSGVEAIREIVQRQPDARIIALSMAKEPELVERTIIAGARGYLLKDQRAAVLLEGIRIVASGGVAIDPYIGAHLLDEYRRLAAAAHRAREEARRIDALPEGESRAAATSVQALHFSPRELEILERLASGLSNRQIAAELFLSEQTVKNLLATIYQKLGVRNRTEAVMDAVQRGIVKRKS